MGIDEISASEVYNDSQEVPEPESEAGKFNKEIKLEEQLTGLKNTFPSLDRSDPLRLRILTIAPEKARKTLLECTLEKIKAFY